MWFILSSDIYPVLIHLDQHFIERGPYRSERERMLEILGWGRTVRGLISPTCLESINNSPGPCYQLSLLHTQNVGRAQGHQEWSRRQRFSHFTLITRGGRSVCEARRRSLPLGETGDHHQQQGPKAILQRLGEVSK